ncbi:hypothetical protein EON81_21130 [bacterium]|nr:MAG: hypothetical protein EON81_21130 [bacterium]
MLKIGRPLNFASLLWLTGGIVASLSCSSLPLPALNPVYDNGGFRFVVPEKSHISRAPGTKVFLIQGGGDSRFYINTFTVKPIKNPGTDFKSKVAKGVQAFWPDLKAHYKLGETPRPKWEKMGKVHFYGVRLTYQKDKDVLDGFITDGRNVCGIQAVRPLPKKGAKMEEIRANLTSVLDSIEPSPPAQ